MANGWRAGIDACLEFLRSVIDRDDAEDYQTVRDLALVSLHPVDPGRLSLDSILMNLPGIAPPPAAATPGSATQPAARAVPEPRRYM